MERQQEDSTPGDAAARDRDTPATPATPPTPHAMYVARQPDGSTRLLTSIDLDHPLHEVFRFFADARNLEQITPPWLRFSVVTPGAVEMRAGARIDYRLRLRGLPVRWQSEITAWEPPVRFVDEQRRGPYRQWLHEHRFEELPGGRTRVIDDVRYRTPGGALVDRLLVAPDVRRIFTWRHTRLLEEFPPRRVGAR